MKKIIFIILIISCIFKQYVYGQYRSLDSLNKIIKLEKNVIKKINLYNCLVKEYINIGSYDTALTYSIKEKQLSEKQGYKKGLANAYENIGSVFEYQSKYPEALKNQFASLYIRNEIFDKEGQANCYSNIGVIYDCQGNYPNALKHHFLSLKLFEKLNNKIGIANSYSNIGLIYDEQGNYDEALKNYGIALNISKLAGEKQGIATSYNNIGSIYYVQGDYTKALKNHFASLKIKKELNDLQGIAYSYNNIGTAYNKLQDYKNSLHYQRLALNIFIEIGDKSGETNSRINIGGTELKKSNLIIAKRNMDSAFIIANDIDFMDYKKTCYQYFSRIDSAMGNFNDAYNNYKLFIQYRDSLNNKEIQKKTTEQRMTYEFEKKEIASKAEQDIKDKSAKEEKQQQQLIIFTVALILLIVLIFSALLFKRFRLTNKQKGIIEQQKHLVEEKHKEITDSINYAERIQRTFLATNDLLNQHLHNYFIYFKPKDVVSGDFYWASTIVSSRDNFFQKSNIK